MRPFRVFLAAALWLLAGGSLVGCSTVHYPINAALPAVSPTTGYRMQNVFSEPGREELLVVLTFSGGGARAAALAYGALEELARHPIEWRGERKRLIDEVDLVYGVSGGAITAAYWGLAGDRLFTEFEPRFLARDLQSQLLDGLASASNLWRLGSPRFGRGELLAEQLDDALFQGATFADLAARKGGPFVVVSAADLSSGARFDFTQDYFDLLCSDLGRFPVARAVAASSAVPVVFAPITLWNHAGTCGYAPPRFMADLADTQHPRHLGESRKQQRAREMLSYLDTKEKPYVHLVDGGVADNLALRGLLEAEEFASEGDPSVQPATPPKIRKVLFLVVDAGTDPTTQVGKSADVPRLGDIVNALADIPIQRFSAETRLLLQAAFERWRTQATIAGQPQDDLQLYMVEVSLRAVADAPRRRAMMALPTTLFLPGADVRALRDVAGRLIRESPDFQRLMKAIESRRSASGAPRHGPDVLRPETSNLPIPSP
jgi:NTE family protein